LGDEDINFPFHQVEDSGLEGRQGLEGTIAFHAAVLVTMGVWETEWDNVLDQIDNCLQMSLDQTLDREKLAKWMFDDDFERSAQYFAILQILCIFGECISTVSDDLRCLDGLFLQGPPFFPVESVTPDELQALRSNWKSVIDAQEKAAERLTARLTAKTEEVKSLRDGV
jgi:hypothetical protein